MEIKSSKKAQMEMSVGTMVTIVLLLIVLVLGIFFIQKIFKSGSNAIDTIDSQTQSELQKLFANENAKIAFYPTSRDVAINKGDDPKGFAFQIRNNDVEEAVFTFTTTATDASKCGSTFNEEKANNLLLGGSGTISVGPSDISEARIVKFVIPDSAPSCTVEYSLNIKKGTVTYAEINFFLIIK